MTVERKAGTMPIWVGADVTRMTRELARKGLWGGSENGELAWLALLSLSGRVTELLDHTQENLIEADSRQEDADRWGGLMSR